MARRKRRLASRVRSCVRSFLAFLFSNIGIVVLLVAYTIAGFLTTLTFLSLISFWETEVRLLYGAFTFQAIEGESEIERVHHMSRERNNTAHYLWQNVTLALNLFNETALKDRISLELHQYQRKIVMAVRRGWDGGRSSRQWSFSSAFLYSLTVITTIGYGHLSPRTSWGKIATILYALLGMPIFLLYLSNVGELLASWFKCLYSLVCLCRGCPGFTRRRVVRLRAPIDFSEAESIEGPEGCRPSYSESDDTPELRVPPDIAMYYHRRPEYIRSTSMPQPWRDARVEAVRGWSEPVGYRGDSLQSSDFSYVTFDAQNITVPISMCISILVGYIMFGSMIFGMWEKWDKLDGAYFCFISLSSIGFGDFVPGERVYTPRIETSFIVCSLYLMLGMALVAMCFNLMQEQVIHYVAGIKRALKRICRCKR